MTRVRDPDYDLSSFDAIILMTHIWVDNPTTAMNSFLRKVNLQEKRVILGVVAAGDENLKAADKLTKMIKSKGGVNGEVVYLKGAILNRVGEPLSERHVNTEAEKIT